MVTASTAAPVAPMSDTALLQYIYARESPNLQTNDWNALRLRVRNLLDALCPPQSRSHICDLLRTLRLRGELMFLPDWKTWGIDEDETDGTIVPSSHQREPNPVFSDPPAWGPRGVYLPSDLEAWSIRTRVAEISRVLYANRERFGLESATAHLGYELQPRFRPDRTTATMDSVVNRLQTMVDAGRFARATDPDALKLAIDVVAAGLGHASIAGFQERAWEAILSTLFATQRPNDATMITAGVSSGKTYSFLLPALTLAVYRALTGAGRHNRILVIYPRTSLVEDQFHNLRQLIVQINAQLSLRRPGVSITEPPALDAGQMLADSLGVAANSLAEVLPHVSAMGVELILTTPESLKNRMLDPRAVRTYLEHVELVVFDEIHLMEGVAGCHGIHFVRRLRQLLKDLHNDEQFEPAWVGASATVAEPVEHCARVLTLQPSRVLHVAPSPSELVRFGTFHHVFLHTRVGKASISAITNGLSLLVHNRNDCTPYNHYVDPTATPRVPLPTEEIRKTIAFVDSLSTIGRLRFTIADNERTYEPNNQTPPYYSWFFRPASRLRATQQEEANIGTQRLAQLRDWCHKCYHGQPARIDASAFQVREMRFLRTSLRMNAEAETRSTPPGFPQALRQLSGQVGNLDECPFHNHQLCWWFSHDSGERLALQTGGDRVAIDQARVHAYTSKTDDVDGVLQQNVNDYFLTRSFKLWERTGNIPDTPEDVSVMLASPRIEVGVDFRNVRDGVTHKAMRSAASFQQKVGRVGREENSDSLIVTFLAHRPTDAHFAHFPARLIDAAHLDPIPLKSENPDVVRNHMFAAALEYIASRHGSAIPSFGRELNIIGTGSSRLPESWEDKVNACLLYIGSNRTLVRAYLLSATGHSDATAADQAIDRLLHILGVFVVDLTGAYRFGNTPAHWFKANLRPEPEAAFEQTIARIDRLVDDLDALETEVPTALTAAVHALRGAIEALAPTQAQITAATNNLQSSALPLISTTDPSVVGRIFTVVAEGNAIAASLSGLTISAPFSTLREAYAIVQAFFEDPDPGARVRSQYYLHDILTKLLPFRRHYPFGLVRTHFQHVNQKQVRILIEGSGADTEDYESLSTALYELLPGTWNYRWLKPKKSPCGPIDQMAGTAESFCNLSQIERPNGAAFEPTGGFLTPIELPADMPTAGTNVPILRPTRLRMQWSYNQPSARFDTQLIGDDDEAPKENDPKRKLDCPTLPRAFPATWYRVQERGTPQQIVGEAQPSHPTSKIPHTFPAVGRTLFSSLAFSTELETDRYVYAIDRSYGSGVIESPRIHYRRGQNPLPVVIGDTLGKTDGLTFDMRPSAANHVLTSVLSSPNRVRGEMTARALGAWAARTTGAGPFQAEMLRKVILVEHLDQGGTLRSLDAATIQGCIAAINPTRYDQIVAALLDGVFAGVDPAEAAGGRSRQTGWYRDAWAAFSTLQTAVATFTDVAIEETAREILVHTLAVTTLEALGRLVGASDGDLAYFHRHDQLRYFVFDSVEGGNGCAETIARFMHIPPLRRIIASRAGGASTLPSSDGFMLLEEALAPCKAQSATQLVFAACQLGIIDPSHLRFPRGLVADLQARARHEYDPVAGSQGVVAHLLATQPGLFSSWQDIFWLQLVPERFALALVTANVAANFESLKARTHLCVTGCLECVDNGDQSVYGALRSREHVSKNLLAELRAHIIASEPQAFVSIAANVTVGQALQANTSRPVLDASGNAITVQIDDDGTPRQLLLTQYISTVAPDLSIPGAPLLTPSAAEPGKFDVRIPFLAGYRDERPIT